MMCLKLVHFCLSNSIFLSGRAANLSGCHLQSLQSCLQGIQEITLPGQPTLQGAGPRWRSRSASIRWLPATSRSPPTSSMPLKSGNKQNSSRENRKVRAASGGLKPPESAGTLPGFDFVDGALGDEHLQNQGESDTLDCRDTPGWVLWLSRWCWSCDIKICVVFPVKCSE